MIERTQHRHLQAAEKGTPSSGGLVFVRVLERTGNGAFAVEHLGKRIEVRSSKDLVPGEERSGRLVPKGKGFEFLPAEGNGRSRSPEARNAGTPLPSPGPAPAAAETARSLLVQAFVRAGLVPPGKERLRELSEIAGKDGAGTPKRRAALAARMEEKGLSPDREAFDRVMELLEGGSSREERKRRRGDGKRTGASEEILTAEDEGSSPLQVFNHVAAETGSWTILPYGFRAGDLAYTGSIRLWYNGTAKRWEKAVLSVREESAGKTWFFSWTLGKGSSSISVFTDDERWSDRRERAEFKRKLRKLGLKSDDNFNKEEDFDGFEAGRDVSRLVDAVV